MNPKQKLLLKKSLAYNILKYGNLNDLNLPYEKYIGNDISGEVINMIKTTPRFIYPIKSYCTAIIYSLLIEEYFGISFYDSISNPYLLLLDQFYVPYSKNKKIYKRVISHFGKNNILDINSSTVEITKDFFKDEFLL